MMTVTKARMHDVLGPIILDHPEAFGEDEHQDWEQLTLTLFMFHEIIKGRDSYWYPYLRMMPDVEFTTTWSDVFEMFQDQRVEIECAEYDVQLDHDWKLFKDVLEDYPNIFPAKYVRQDLFTNLFAQVCTRCFGYGLESCSMIPMADNLNHSSVTITNECVNIPLHLNGPLNSNYYRVGKFFNDYTPIFEKHCTKEEIEQNKQNIKGRFNRKIYEENQQSLSIENLRA